MLFRKTRRPGSFEARIAPVNGLGIAVAAGKS
jgi:hypothetical protein